MNEKNVSLEYANALMYDLEKAFWDERGRGARFRMTKVGQEFFRSRCGENIESSDTDAIVRAVDEALRQEGVVADISFTSEDRQLKVRVSGCIHRSVEQKLAEHGVEPFTCLPANLIVLAIEEKLNRPVELAEIKVEGDRCQLLLILFDKRPE